MIKLHVFGERLGVKDASSYVLKLKYKLIYKWLRLCMNAEWAWKALKKHQGAYYSSWKMEIKL